MRAITLLSDYEQHYNYCKHAVWQLIVKLCTEHM